jgi:dipeptidyl aminopeptidase/acylaminoacyl peptidase
MDLLVVDQQFKETGVKGFQMNIPGSYGSKYLGKTVSEVPELARLSNPETYITPDDPPVFIQHGTEDVWVPVQQSINFAAKLEQILGPQKVTLEIMQGAGHGGQPFNNAQNVNKVLDFLDQTLKP